jgi:hypothetical protein
MRRISLVCLLIPLLPFPAPGADFTDPPATRLEWPAALSLDLAIPTKNDIPTLAFAEHGGPFVIGGTSPAFPPNTLVTYDLRTGTKTATATGPFAFERVTALRRDGKVFAAFRLKKQGPAVFDTSGKLVCELTATASALGFVGTDRVFAHDYTARTAELFDASSGLSRSKIALGAGNRATPASSPGGKYLFADDGASIKVYDTTTTKVVGALPTTVGDVQYVSVSPDGRRLAALIRVQGEYLIDVWDLGTGAKSGPLTPRKPYAGGFGHKTLAWSADGRFVLYYSTAVIDAASGKTVLEVPTAFFTERAVGPGGVALYLEPSNPADVRLKSFAPTPEQVRAALAGGEPAAAPFANPALATTRNNPFIPATPPPAPKAVAPAVGVAWAVKPDPGPAGGTAKVTASVPVPFADVYGLHVGRGEKPFALLEVRPRVNGQPMKGEHFVVRLDRVDLSSGKVVSSVTVTVGTVVAGTSPDCDTVTMVRGSDVQVWSMSEGKIREWWGANGGEKLTFAAPLAGGKVVTVTSERVTVWKVGKPVMRVASVELPKLSGATLSPGGKYLVGVQNDAVRFVDLETCKLVGDLQPGFQVFGQSLFAFSPGGTELVGVLSGTGFEPHRVVRWDLTTGKRIGEPGPAPRFFDTTGVVGVMKPDPTVRFLGANHVLIDGRDVYDLKRRGPVWEYGPREVRVAPDVHDSRLWYATPSASGGATFIVGIPAAPAAEVEQAAVAVADSPNLVLRPGTKVEFRVTGGRGGAALTDHATHYLKRLITDAGLEATEKGSNVGVLLTVGERATGKTLTYTTAPKRGAPKKRFDIAEVELKAQVQLFVSGRAVWSSHVVTRTTDEVAPDALKVFEDDGNTQLDAFLYERAWRSVVEVTETAAFPRFVAVGPKGVLTLPGASVMGSNGLTRK